MSDEEEEEISKFEEAEDAGTKNGHLCTLILADGWNAAAISIAGLSVLGRNQYGMYRLLNFTQEAMHKNILEIPEIETLINIIGLQVNTDYSTEAHLETLRYGKLMILTDQNEEGANFKGLFINFIYENWPNLLHLSFLEQFITPVVKVTRGQTKYSFFSLAEFEEWKVDKPDTSTYTVKHYRGLGANNRNEAKEYFSNMDFHRVSFKYSAPQDDQNLIKAFGKDANEKRRDWLSRHMNDCKLRKALGLQDKYLYTGKTKAVSISEFINLEYVSFAHFDIVRSIPSIVDGFKPGQRKVLFTCVKRNDKNKIRVAQLACSVAEEAGYFQGELSLCKIIYSMAQNYVGSNNINLLIPFGQFGTRLMGGEDCAEHYYIHTMLSPLARLIFHPHDDPLLSFNTDGNQKIEPMQYIPIIPMILVNGSEGTGTGWSTNIPKHDPHQLIRCLRKMIAGKVPETLIPYYRNYRGTIRTIGSAGFIATGCLAIIEGDGEQIEITELPIGVWTKAYKESVLEQLLNGSEMTKPIITDYQEHHTDTTVRFVISFAPGEFRKLQNEVGGFHRIFKLYRIIKTNNMHGFDGSNRLRRYETTDEILKEFYNQRLRFYVKRKYYLEGKLTAEADKLNNQVKFIIAKSCLVVENKTFQTMIDELIALGYQPDPVEKWKLENGIRTNDDEREEFQHLSSEEKVIAKKYDYLLNMSMWMLTEEVRNQLINRRDVKVSKLNVLKEKSEYDLWLSDLKELENYLCGLEEKERIDVPSQQDNSDLHPSDDGKNVEFKITDEFFEQYCRNIENE